jgi:purine nucleosidase
MPQKVILDIDTGVDDALALLLALASPELEVIGCTTVAGNVTVDLTTRNTLAVLELAGRTDIPVAMGAAAPLVRRLTTATYFHGPEGLAHVELPRPKISALPQTAPQFLIEQADKYPGELVVIATAPLTNLALTLKMQPEWGRSLQKLVIMGGAVRCPGNVTPAAEANIYNDPEAARIVFESGAHITLVGLDVTMKCGIPASQVRKLAEERERLSPIARFALDTLLYYNETYPPETGAALHDPLAVGVVANPALVRTERMQVEVETQGKITRGMTLGGNGWPHERLEDRGSYDDCVGVGWEYSSNAEVCLEVDSSAFITMFRQRLGLE